jgi:hypothetical protein
LEKTASCSCARTGYLGKIASYSCAGTRYSKKRASLASFHSYTRSVCHELEPRGEQHDEESRLLLHAEVMIEYRDENFDWASKNMKEIEALNHASCQWLQEKGYNAKALKAKANVRPNSLNNTRIAQASSAEERVKAIVASGILLSSLFHTIGPSCLSVDEIFVAFEYRERLKAYENEKKEYAKVLKAK